MSKREAPREETKVVPGEPTPIPSYRYQCYQGQAGSASAQSKPTPQRQFAALRNFVLNAE